MVVVRQTALILLVVIEAAALGCGGDPVVRARVDALVAVETAVGNRQYPVGEALAREFVTRADIPLAERCAALLALGKAIDGQLRPEEALDVLATVGRSCAAVPEASADGLMVVAGQALRRGDLAVAGRVLERVVTSFPDEIAARKAADELRDLRRASGGDEAAIEALRRLYLSVPARGVSPYLLFQAARLIESAPDISQAARLRALALYRRIVDVHGRSPQANDAMLAAARQALELGRTSEAADLLEKLLSQREWSFLLGSYSLSIYPDAAFLRAEVAVRAGDAGLVVAEWYDLFVGTYPKDSRAPLARLRAATAAKASGDQAAFVSRLSSLAVDCPKTPAGLWAAATLAGVDPGPEPAP